MKIEKKLNNATRLIKFGLVGAVNTLLDFSVFIFLVRAMELDPLWSNFISYVAAVINSYILNMLWTFRSSSEKKLDPGTFVVFVSVNSIGLVIGTSVILAFQSIMAVEAAKIIAVFSTLAWNFVGTRHFVFNGAS